jgi:hypothetical protein
MQAETGIKPAWSAEAFPGAREFDRAGAKVDRLRTNDNYGTEVLAQRIERHSSGRDGELLEPDTGRHPGQLAPAFLARRAGSSISADRSRRREHFLTPQCFRLGHVREHGLALGW